MDLAAAQDVEAGDGTTSVVVLCGSMLYAAEKMLNKGEFFAANYIGSRGLRSC